MDGLIFAGSGVAVAHACFDKEVEAHVMEKKLLEMKEAAGYVTASSSILVSIHNQGWRTRQEQAIVNTAFPMLPWLHFKPNNGTYGKAMFVLTPKDNGFTSSFSSQRSDYVLICFK